MTRGYAAANEYGGGGNPEALAAVGNAMEAAALALVSPPKASSPEYRWFSSSGAVVVKSGVYEVLVGGLSLGEFRADDRDRGRRNVLAVTLAKSGVHLGRLAMAFGMGEEYLRRLRRKEETGGPAAVLLLRSGANSKVTPATRATWYEQFDAGMTPTAVHREQPRRGRLSTATVGRVVARFGSGTFPSPAHALVSEAARAQSGRWCSIRTSASSTRQSPATPRAASPDRPRSK